MAFSGRLVVEQMTVSHVLGSLLSEIKRPEDFDEYLTRHGWWSESTNSPTKLKTLRPLNSNSGFQPPLKSCCPPPVHRGNVLGARVA
jgi:hypothetical protein